jgi:spoIIIJ-associated protein
MENDELIAALKGILEKIGIAFDDIEVSEAAGHTLYTIHTKDSGVLIGSSGDTLHALNHVMKKLVEGTKDERHFMVDVNGYHLKHIRALETQAKILAERARTFKYDVEMSPMSAYDRLIVHASLTNEPDVATESSGEGKLRHVVIKYAPQSGSALTAPIGTTADATTEEV